MSSTACRWSTTGRPRPCPPPAQELEAIARFCGHADSADFTETLLRHLGNVEDHYAELFEEAPTLAGPGGSLVFTGTDNDPDTVRTLGELGFKDGASISAAIRGWHAGRARAMRSTRARELLTELMPTLLQALGRTSQPDEAFARFDTFLHALPAGVQIFSLLYSNPGLLDLIAEIMGGAPRLAEHLSRNPALLDAVLTSGFFAHAPARQSWPRSCSISWRSPAICRTSSTSPGAGPGTGNSRSASMCCAATTDAEHAARPLSDIAETVIAALQPRVEAAFVQPAWQAAGARHGDGGAGQARQP